MIYYAVNRFIEELTNLLVINQIYQSIILIIMQLTDFLDRYQIYYAIIRFIMNYQPINRFIGKKYKIKVPG